MVNIGKMTQVETEFRSLFRKLVKIEDDIKQGLIKYADDKNLKGNERVGWLGEIYGKLLLGGKLVVDDKQEHDIETKDGKRISVKTRKGFRSGWQRTSAIPKIIGKTCPTHLLFVHLKDDYSVDRIWLFEWHYLSRVNRFNKHIVRGEKRSFVFTLSERDDQKYLIYNSANI